MNLMVVSEKHKFIIIAVEHQLWVFKFDFHKLKFSQQPLEIKGNPYYTISLDNDDEAINNLKLIKCDGREFVCTVDFGGNVRMLFLDNLQRECIKFKNEYPSCSDNSTWSLCGASTNPPRVVVGSNAHKVTVFNLQTGLKSTINAHSHNVPCVSFSPCGKFIASTSIDKSVKVWTEYPPDSGAYVLVKVCYPSQDWGWAVQWIDKQKCEVIMEIDPKLAYNSAARKSGGKGESSDDPEGKKSNNKKRGDKAQV